MDIKKIVIVDDEQDFCETVKAFFEADDGYRVIVETNPEKAVKTIIKQQPNIVLLDIIMPKKGGFEVLEELKKDNKTLSIPVIMLTALDQEPPKVKASESYADDYITKPVSMAVLKEKVETIIKSRVRK